MPGQKSNPDPLKAREIIGAFCIFGFWLDHFHSARRGGPKQHVPS